MWVWPGLRLAAVAGVALLAGWAASIVPSQRASRVPPAAALAGLDRGDATQLGRPQVAFLLMPLMHAEDRGLQTRCVAAFEALTASAEGPLKAHCENFTQYARGHRDIVKRFGRFPHRNALLGRETTPEEAEFLTQPGSSYF